MEVKLKFTNIIYYLTDFWNMVQWGSIILFMIGIGLRFVPDMEFYLAARYLLNIVLKHF